MDNDDVINVLSSLIATCNDGEQGFRRCSANASRGDLRQVFANRAEDCRRAALELRTLVTRHGGSAAVGGTVGVADRLRWSALDLQLAGGSDLTLLDECERGEGQALEQYRRALAEDLPGGVSLLVQRQFNGVKIHHAQMRALRDDARTAAHA